MKRIRVLIWSVFLLWSCDKENIDPEKYVMPVSLVASRDQESILLKWHLNTNFNLSTSNYVYLPNAVRGEVFRLYYSANDSLDFRFVENFTRESNSFRFVPDRQAENHYFRLEIFAANARPSKVKVQVQLGQNPATLNLLDYPYDYNSAIGNFDPDNRHLVFSRNYRWKDGEDCCTDYSLFSYDVLTDETTFLFEEAYNPQWSPEGDRIIFTSGFGMKGNPAPSNLGLFNYVSDSIIQLTYGMNEFKRPIWFPDGSQVIFLSKISENSPVEYWDLYRYDHFTRESNLLATGNSLKILNLPYSLSPDGKKLAYVDYSENGYYSIRSFDLETMTMRLEIESGWHDFNPSWSPDGRFLAFLSYRSGKPEIWLKELATGDLRQVTGEEDHYIDSELVWSRDSRQIFFKLYLDQVFGIYQVTI